MPDNDGIARLDRIETALELLIADRVQFREEHTQLLAAQIVLTDRLDLFIQANAEAQKRTDERMAKLADKLNGPIGYVQGMQPPPKS
jgi:hypothetical protein